MVNHQSLTTVTTYISAISLSDVTPFMDANDNDSRNITTVTNHPTTTIAV